MLIEIAFYFGVIVEFGKYCWMSIIRERLYAGGLLGEAGLGLDS